MIRISSNFKSASSLECRFSRKQNIRQLINVGSNFTGISDLLIHLADPQSLFLSVRTSIPMIQNLSQQKQIINFMFIQCSLLFGLLDLAEWIVYDFCLDITKCNTIISTLILFIHILVENLEHLWCHLYATHKILTALSANNLISVFFAGLFVITCRIRCETETSIIRDVGNIGKISIPSWTVTTITRSPIAGRLPIRVNNQL